MAARPAVPTAGARRATVAARAGRRRAPRVQVDGAHRRPARSRRRASPLRLAAPQRPAAAALQAVAEAARSRAPASGGSLPALALRARAEWPPARPARRPAALLRGLPAVA